MSGKGVAALIGATGVAGAVIFYVHKLQDEERKSLRQGVYRDIERQEQKKQFQLEQEQLQPGQQVDSSSPNSSSSSSSSSSNSSDKHDPSAGDSAVLSATGEIKIPTRGLSRSSGGVGVNLGSSGDGDGVDSDDDSTSASSLFAPSRANAVGDAHGDSSSSRSTPLEARLAGINLDDVTQTEKVWNSLTLQEQALFSAAKQAGTLAAMLDPWTPWWRNVAIGTDGRSAGIAEVDTHRHQQHQHQHQPVGSEDAAAMAQPPVSAIASGSVAAAIEVEGIVMPVEVPALVRAPAAGLEMNLVDIVLSYVYTCRLFHGDVLSADVAHEAAQVFLSASYIFDGATTCHPSPSEAVQRVLVRLRAVPGLDTSSATISETLGDVAAILPREDLVAAILVHSHQIMCAGKFYAPKPTKKKKKATTTTTTTTMRTRTTTTATATNTTSPTATERNEQKDAGSPKKVLLQGNRLSSATMPAGAGGAAAESSSAMQRLRSRATLKQAERKAWFYVRWWHHLRLVSGAADCLSALATIVAAEKMVLDEQSASIAQGTAALETAWGGRRPVKSTLIEEL
eukprot:gene13692-26170_t